MSYEDANMSQIPPFSLEIFNHSQEQLAMLTVTNPSEQLTYTNIRGALQHYMPETSIHAFKYVDEEGDFITVRTDSETADMIKAFVMTNFNQALGAFTGPLVIYPSNDSRKDNSGRRRPDLHVEVSPSGSVSSHLSSAGMQSSPMVHALGSAGSLSSMNGSPDPARLQQIMNGPLSSDLNQLNLDQLQYDPDTDRLGAGNGGSVFKVLHKTSNSTIALKVIALDVSSAEVQKQIISELAILQTCKSPFIISFWGASFRGNEIYMATEFMDGGSLDRYMPIEEPVLGRISVMVVHGLKYLWDINILHRDVKPSNMLVNSQGIVKLCDFGVSRQLIQSTAMTYCGTHAYMSPERLTENKGYKIQSDLWSLGVSLYEMAMGGLPFPPDSLDSPMPLFKSISEGKTNQLPNTRFRPEMCLFVGQCLGKLPEQRPHPKTLLSHPFIVMYNDGDTGMVADWLKHRLGQNQLSSTN